ncbi:alternate-type signal peptide domain-containing protein [Salinibacterium sp. PAMC 21357]|uniref:alternate-type signal peptide domain-containing protein n=1 Tax=Salinibacterium sp. PAMC 21357 TaxID=1112215 RepID=UPI0002899179|nr:alternate-type signal peptide domain-containing protein [Salinibacterium sp. PAMC 21357]
MNKLVKGSIAGAAGIALLLGGAGTLATWNSSAAVTSAATGITAGTLEITPTSGVSTDGWKVGTPGTGINISTFKIVPGDVLTFTKTFDVAAVGNNLTATAALGTGAITAASAAATGGPLAQDTALATTLTNNASFAFTVDGSASPTVTANTNTKKIVVTVTLTYPKGAVTVGNDSKLGAVNLGAFAVTLTQN